MSTTAEHARRELALMGEDPEMIEWYVGVIDKYFEFGHSGGSVMATLPILVALIQHQNLTMLTSNPEEWQDLSGQADEPMWQNIRNSEAFSDDGGKTYWLLSEGANSQNRSPRHTA